MNPIPSLSGISRLVGDHVWHSTFVAIVAVVLAWILRRNRAHVRHWIWLAALAKFLVPFAMFAIVGEQLGSWALPRTPLQFALPFGVEAASQPFSSGPVGVLAIESTSKEVSSALPFALPTIWLFGFAVVLVTWWSRWRRMARVVGQATPVASGRLLDALRRVEQRMGSQ